MSAKLISKLKQYRHDGQRWHHIFTSSPKRKDQCRVIYCKRLARVWVRPNLRVSQRSICDTCASRLFRANHPAHEAYRQIKDRALRRNQIFTITLEDLLRVPRIDEYLERRGRGIDDLHLDRIKVERGYVPGNLQVLTTAENLHKRWKEDYARVEQPF